MESNGTRIRKKVNQYKGVTVEQWEIQFSASIRLINSRNNQSNIFYRKVGNPYEKKEF